MDSVNQRIQNAEHEARQTGDRTAAKGRKGHQKTPAFISSVVSDAVQYMLTGKEAEGSQPRGGFTDVGLHTGGTARDTCWALVREAVLALLSQLLPLRDSDSEFFEPLSLSPKQLVAVAEASMCLWLLEHQLALLTPETAMPSSVTVVVDMLEHTALLGAQLADCVSDALSPPPAAPVAGAAESLTVDTVSVDPPAGGGAHMATRANPPAQRARADLRGGIEAVTQRLHVARGKLDELVQAREKARASKFRLPDQGSVDAPVLDVPHVILPAKQAPAQRDHADLLAIATRALGGLPLLPPHAKVRQALAWLQQPTAQVQGDPSAKEMWAHLALRGLEQVVLGIAVAARARGGPGWVQPDVVPGQIIALVKRYRRLLEGDAKDLVARMKVEARSQETLMVWVAFCVADARGCAEHPLLKEYGVALRWEGLRHLVLGDRLAVDAALAVGEYLRFRTIRLREVFTLRDAQQGWHAQTIGMAGEMARRSGESRWMASLWQQELEDANKRVDGHWREVLRKQQLVRKLRAELAGLNLNLEGHRRKRKDAEEASAAASQRLNAHTYSSARCSCSSWGHIAGCTWEKEREDRQASVDSARKRANSARTTEQSCQAEIAAKEKALAEAKRAPAPVYQPLPSDETKGMSLLFLMNMPELLRQVAQLAFTAQQMLLPYPWTDKDGRWDVATRIGQPSFTQQWHDYYNAKQVCEYHKPAVVRSGSTGMVLLGTRAWPPVQVGPRDVEQCLHKSDGIWHPDSLAPSLGWKGCGFAPAGSQDLFDPFAAIPNYSVVDYYSELLRDDIGDTDDLQWAIPLDGTDDTDATRGNIAIAEQKWRPSWLSKPQYLAFGALRAYPNQQVRKMCIALRDKLLPLDRPAVHTLLRMAAYHLGELDVPVIQNNAAVGGSSADDSTRFEELFPRWHTDLWLGGAADALCEELHALLEELRPSPQRHGELMILAELAGYLGERHAGCLAVARGFGQVARAWGDQLEAQLADNPAATRPDDSAPAAAAHGRAEGGGKRGKSGDHDGVVRLRQRLFYLYSLLCYRSGPLLVSDASTMVELSVLISYTRVFEEEGQADPSEALTDDLAECCRSVMAGRVGDVLQVLGEEVGTRDRALTAAFKLVVQQGVPESLSWEQAADSRACFHAQSNDGRLYSINVLSGAVLVDGNPPGRLPAAILEHPLYKAVFGDKSFEVSTTADGVHCVTRSVGGRWYEFVMLADDRLLAVEVDRSESAGARLELLDPEEGWARDLPIRLVELHSHWLCRDPATHPGSVPYVVFRPRDFRQHQVSFLMECLSNESGDCLRVPDALCWQPCSVLAGGMRSSLTQYLMLARAGDKDPLLRVLSKFESLDYIHIFEEGSAVSFHLPRLNLEFVLRNGRVESRDYRGYALASQQQLLSPVTLPEFTQYLVLQASPSAAPPCLLPSGRVSSHGLPDTLVVMPQESGNNALAPSAFIERDDDDCEASLSTHTYRLHGRWPLLQATSVSARLQLAAVFAAPGSLAPLPGCLGGMAGPEAALTLVRQCRVSYPLTKQDGEQLWRIARFGVPLLPALAIACNALERSSLELHFLYTEGVPRWRPGLEVEWAAPHLVCGSPDAHTAYMHECRHMPVHSRRRLTRDEAAQELACAGGDVRVGAAAGSGLGRVMPAHGTLEVCPCPVADDYVTTVEKDLQSFRGRITEERRTDVAAPLPPYPLSTSSPSGAASSSRNPRGGISGHADTGSPARKRSKREKGLEPTVLSAEMDEELRASWQRHHEAPGAALGDGHTATSLGGHFGSLLAKVSGDRARVESHVMWALSRMPSVGGWHAAACRMLVSAALLPAVTLWDLACMACNPRLIGQFNPFLSQRAKQAVLGAVLLWLEMCVLEDKVARLLAYATSGDHLLLLQELEVFREWDVREHPHWLVFEAENGLQIRPKQHAVARHMIENPGSIVQLNMGEGKTRVILPMLVLHWANGRNTVRLNLLSSLLDEAHDYLHGCLCAGVLGRRLTVLPFNRDVQITERGARTLAHHVQLLTRSGGILLAAPEHRLSLKLKWHELAARPGNEAKCRLLAQLDNRDVIEILDESDELLHHRRELVYACGAPVPLPNGPNRWTGIQALFRVLWQGIQGNGEVWQILTRPGVCVGLERPGASLEGEKVPGVVTGASSSSKAGHLASYSHGEFIPIRLVPGDALTACLPELRACLLGGLIRDPPYELSWLGRGDAVRDARIVQFVTDPAQEGQGQLGLILPEGGMYEEERASLLMLRGLLAGNMFFHALEKRHLVEYGVDRRLGSTRKKRLAVPFRAHNQPSDRSEWAHPDAALMLTTLAYYQDGLTLGQMVEGLRTLLDMAPSTQAHFYNGWLAICSRPGQGGPAAASPAIVKGAAMSGSFPNGVEDMNGEDEEKEWAAIDMVEKVDLTNAVNLALLHRKLGRNMEVINFWLAYCLFPRETNQFEKRMSASAWDLAQASGTQGRVVGFSGTNDLHRLMPLQVSQNDLPSLQGTSGKMLDLLLREDEEAGSYTTLAANAGPSWLATLDLCVERGVNVLLDAGAFLVGASNRGAAEYLLPCLLLGPSSCGRAAFRERFPGVIYFDTTLREWMVRDRSGWCVPLSRSPIAPADAFVIYDESRCRGTDLKLRPDALALVTLSARMTKDKLMQAAGRMRQLDKGQRLLLVGNAELSDKVVKANGLADVTWPARTRAQAADLVNGRQVEYCIRPSHVMRVVMANTVEATQEGLVRASVQGVHFGCTHGAPQRALVDEDQALGSMYASALTEQWAAELVDKLVAQGVDRCKGAGSLDGGMAAMLAKIRDRGRRYGGDFHVVVSQVALGELAWDYASIFGAKSPTGLPTQVLSLRDVMGWLDPTGLKGMPWPGSVWVTSNFLHGTREHDAATSCDGMKLNEFLRAVDAVLYFRTRGEALLLSEGEADAVLALLWERDGLVRQAGHPLNRGSRQASVAASSITGTRVELFHLSYAGRAPSAKPHKLEAPQATTHCPRVAAAINNRRPSLNSFLVSGQRPALLVDSPHATFPCMGSLCAKVATSLLLFSGGTSYSKQEHHDELHRLLRCDGSLAREIVVMRGRLHHFPRSDLERVALHYKEK
eukprot:jgi/Mesvir1/8784/Mv02694-RA.1